MWDAYVPFDSYVDIVHRARDSRTGMMFVTVNLWRNVAGQKSFKRLTLSVQELRQIAGLELANIEACISEPTQFDGNLHYPEGYLPEPGRCRPPWWAWD